jgi:hypothetical protein
MNHWRTFLALVRQIKHTIIAAVFLERHEIRPNRFVQPFELYAVCSGEYRGVCVLTGQQATRQTEACMHAPGKR